MNTQPSVLILGASGGVARAFLEQIKNHGTLFGTLVLLDRNTEKVRSLSLGSLAQRYEYIERGIELPENLRGYTDLLKQFGIDLVVDLTDAESIPLLTATDAAGVSYINTAINSEFGATEDLVNHIYEHRTSLVHGAHILCAGMNPGNVNIFTEYGIRHHGKPDSITHFEFDSSMSKDEWRPICTWSRALFINEAVTVAGGKMIDQDEATKLLPNALGHLVDMKDILSPIISLDSYPSGLPILHEENFSLAYRYDIASEFIYAIHPHTMQYLQKTFAQKDRVDVDDLILGDNTSIPLSGSDLIGVMLSYKDKRVYYVNDLANADVHGTSATYFQVAVGVSAAVRTWLTSLTSGVYFTNELYDSPFTRHVFNDLIVMESIVDVTDGKPQTARTTSQVEVAAS